MSPPWRSPHQSTWIQSWVSTASVSDALLIRTSYTTDTLLFYSTHLSAAAWCRLTTLSRVSQGCKCGLKPYAWRIFFRQYLSSCNMDACVVDLLFSNPHSLRPTVLKSINRMYQCWRRNIAGKLLAAQKVWRLLETFVEKIKAQSDITVSVLVMLHH